MQVTENGQQRYNMSGMEILYIPVLNHCKVVSCSTVIRRITIVGVHN